MPIYEYICNSCKNKFELLRPFNKSQENASCPLCHNTAGRVISTCYAVSTTEGGIPQQLGGSSSCSSCSSGNCSSCSH